MMKTYRAIASLTVSGSTLFAIFMTAQPGLAQGPELSLKERQQWEEMTRHIEEKARDASEKCGTTLTASFDVPSFKGVDIFKSSPTAYCRDAINTVGALCASDVGRASVKKSLATITCKNSSDGTKLGREGRALSISIDPSRTAITGKEKGVSSWKSAMEENFVADPPPGSNGSEMLLRERQQWEEMSKHIGEKAKAASEKCGTTITAKFDVASFKGKDLFKQSPEAACRDAINNVAAICAKETGKAAVAKGVGTITCKRSEDGTKVTRDGTSLSVQLDPTKAIVSKSGGTSWKTALEEIL